MEIIALITVVCSMIVGVWKLFSRKAKEKRENIEAARKTLQEGIAERDESKITAGFNRLRRNK